MEKAPNNKNALASLTKDVVLEILRRLLARSLLCLRDIEEGRSTIVVEYLY
jgi:hypothetical protein